MVVSRHPATSGQLLRELDRRRVRVLRIPDDLDLINSITNDASRSSALVQRLSRAGALRRVRRGAYVVRSRAGTVDVAALDLIGELSPQEHLLTAGKALEIHGLTDQTFRRIIVLVATPVRDWSWLGESVQYAVVKSSDIWGGKPRGKSVRPTRVATAERAILDSFAQPIWGVSLSTATRALRSALQRPDFSSKLASAAARYNSASTARRLGFLVEEFLGPVAAAPFLSLRGTSHTVVPLRPGTRTSGPTNTKWMVRINVDLALLTEIAR